MLVLGRGDPSELLIQAHEQTANLSQELLLALDAHVTSRHTDTHARTHAHTHTPVRLLHIILGFRLQLDSQGNRYNH